MSILVTRPSPSGEQLVSRLTALGQVAHHTPLIEFSPGAQLESFPDLLAELQPEDLVFALSQHAIHYTHAIMQQRHRSWPDSLRYFAIGRTTALRLHTVSGRDVEFPPLLETSEALVQLPSLQNIAGRRALLLRGNGGRELLAETLEQRGVTITLCECYQRSPIHYDGAEQSAHWQHQQISTLVITSGEMLQQLYDLVPEHYRSAWLLSCRVIVVSERLAALAHSLGWRDIRIAQSADNDALIRALQ